MRDMGDWGWIVDASWNLLFITDEQRLSLAYDVEMVPVVIGEHLFGPETTTMSTNWRTEAGQLHETWSTFFANVGAMVLADTPGGKDELRSLVDPSLAAMVDELTASPLPAPRQGPPWRRNTRSWCNPAPEDARLATPTAGSEAPQSPSSRRSA